jgi:hypothetical protein
MSRAQKLVNRAIEILQRRLQPEGLNDQKALAEIRGLLDRTEDDGVGTASERVRLARRTIQQHQENALTNEQAIKELTRIFGGVV